jgi:hypothetical protein
MTLSVRQVLRTALFAIGGIAAFFALWIALSAPSSDRAWKLGLERSAVFTALEEDRWRLDNMRAFAFDEEGPIETAWRSHELRADDLEAVWFFIEPFAGNDAFAHSYLSFEFGGDTDEVISVSVEARMEEGETYSAVKGLMRAFELSYVWSTEKDIHSRIAVNLGHPLRAYRLALEPEHAKAILQHFIARTNALTTEPRFYNTLFSNCTNELAKAVNDAFPGALPWDWSFVLTGHSARHLHEKGYLEAAGAAFDTLRRQADIAGFVRRHFSLAPDPFSAAWRREFASER